MEALIIYQKYAIYFFDKFLFLKVCWFVLQLKRYTTYFCYSIHLLLYPFLGQNV